jgi:hypothetical protein
MFGRKYLNDHCINEYFRGAKNKIWYIYLNKKLVVAKSHSIFKIQTLVFLRFQKELKNEDK